MSRARTHRKPAWPFSVNRDSPQAHGLIGWWPMEPAGGLVLCNLAPRDPNGLNTGALVNGPAWVGSTRGGGGHALSFDGSDDYVDLGDAYDMGTSDWSIGCWFRTTDTDFSLIAKSIYGSGEQWFLFYESGQWTACLTGAATHNVTWTSSFGLDGLWHHACATFDRDGLLTLYLDGVARASGDISSDAARNMSSPYLLLFGRYNDATGLAPHASVLKLAGEIEDVRIYNVVLPPPVVAAMFAPPTRYELYRPGRRSFHSRAIQPFRELALPGSVGTQLNLTGS